ncbi:penicillin-binding protein [Candidatus Shapirobacteria bacterium CG03_land_8_20_14_0_80_40_19]|uniref:Penicillin-binding protein n=4 Tax=Candidatus Shapironibacteriota TaxID=1752721 RepID=A0A2M7BCN9_9BACT|nr:MAG: penicillin-binding protein [Candidatus Shapirobacteria bacterium CG11_big_fil_rev_8_21_14_0_20_40_12]PIV00859.1 MAG: penicillin-binding protein [Candidatus Shapirobacteria bacterium CG03_land_8_20_14_0_80_40_19]PJC28613.1 MAG: penicillin-binding protein [Candidatus Shapirobacteria bacterium CG_4_9_14_0_2_um_filter_40_11]PJC76779.1 MAG: penicillin-binding protein [Candidatus Shapirobacteria bacterium CG_4_8_14_3_um_filter_39_11]
MIKGTGGITRFFIFVGKPFYLLLVLIIYLLGLPSFLISFLKKVKKTKKPAVRKLKTHRHRLRTKAGFLGFIFGIFLSLAVFYYISTIIVDLPSLNKLITREQILTTRIYDRNGVLLYKIFRDKDRTPVNIDDLPPFIIESTISIEDKDFYRHQGLSLRGIIRAFYQNIFQNKKTGGSTITQQLIKNALLSNEKTYQRKIREAVLALLTEKKYTKKQILEMYLNEVGYGGAAYGIEEAAQKYFDKSSKDLNLAEAALLAGLPASPTSYSPFGGSPQIAQQRQALVLKKMVENGYISEEQSQTARAEKLKYASGENEISAPHFMMYVKELLVQKYGEKMVEQGGLEITTSLDLNLQATVQKIVKNEIGQLTAFRISNGAALVTNPKTGEILAMAGSKDYFAKDIDGNYNVTTALRQPGSSIKPVNYSIALENGFTPSSLIEDSPITYMVSGQPPYSPINYDRTYHGLIPLRIALGSSYNVPAVKILAAFGVKKMVTRGQEMGITTWNDSSRFGLSLTLGGGEVKMTDMAVVYGVLANNGIRVDLNPILKVKNSRGKILEENLSGQQTAVLNQGVAFLLTDILADNSARTPAFGQNSQLFIPGRAVAVKTGTTQNLRDNWTIGYTPSRVVVVWVGNNDNTPMSYVASGVTGASPIWRKIMSNLLENSPVEKFPQPNEVKEVYICALTNTLTCNGCPIVKKEYFLTGTEPKTTCTPERIKEILDKKSLPTPQPQIL